MIQIQNPSDIAPLKELVTGPYKRFGWWSLVRETLRSPSLSYAFYLNNTVSIPDHDIAQREHAQFVSVLREAELTNCQRFTYRSRRMRGEAHWKHRFLWATPPTPADRIGPEGATCRVPRIREAARGAPRYMISYYSCCHACRLSPCLAMSESS